MTLFGPRLAMAFLLGGSLLVSACGSSGSTPVAMQGGSSGAIASSSSGGSTSSSGSSSGSTSSSSGSSSGGAVGVLGKSTNYSLVSKVDGAAIAFTVHEPSDFDAAAKYPVILQSHGFGGSRVNAAARPAKGATGLYGRMLDAGYGMVSIDQRGHGDSGGTIRVLDPDFEGKDMIQILDWMEANLPWMLYRDGNPVLGATGGSYGGGYQHTLYGLDAKHRLDALAAEITWYDLRYSLNNGKVFKSYWGSLLSAGGNAAGNSKKGNMDPIITEGLAEGLTTGQIQPDKEEILYNNSLVSYCEGKNPRGTLTKIDALYMQSARDTLFNLNDAKNLVSCVEKLGGDVRFFNKINGHDSGTGEACGKMGKDNAILAWFDEKLKLKANAASYIPKTCFTLGETGSTDAAVVEGGIPVGGIPAQSNFGAQEGNNAQTLSIALMKAGDAGAVLAGVPTIELKVTGVTPSAPSNTMATPGEPVLFFALAVRRAGTTTDTVSMGNQWRPFRGTGEFKTELIGLATRLAKDDEVRLLVKGSEQSRYPGMGSKAGAIVNFSGSVNLPLLASNLPLPPEK